MQPKSKDGTSMVQQVVVTLVYCPTRKSYVGNTNCGWEGDK